MSYAFGSFNWGSVPKPVPKPTTPALPHDVSLLEESNRYGEYRPAIQIYRYRGGLVYTYSDPRVSDGFTTAYDSEGNVIGAPSGGLTGKGDGRLPNFYNEAEYLGTLRSIPRK